jgi:hypothetical protein
MPRNRGLFRAGEGLASATTFNANNWSNLQFWIDPSQSVTVNGSGDVTAPVLDRSPNGRNFDVVNGSIKNNDTENGRKVFTFNTGNFGNSATVWNLPGKAFTLFAVVEFTNLAATSQGVLYLTVNGSTDLSGLMIEARSDRFAVTYGSGAAGGSTTFNARHSATGVLSTGTMTVLTATMDNITGLAAYVNGSLVSLTNFSGSLLEGNWLTSSTTNVRAVSGQRSGSIWPLLGKTGDLFGYTRRMDAAEISAITSALQRKWVP